MGFKIENAVLLEYIEEEGVTEVVIPDSVTSINGFAFSGFSSLTSIIIPDSVTSIGDNAFSGCSSLKSITIPDSVASIGEESFNGCINLVSVTIPDSVASIGFDAFSETPWLENYPDDMVIINGILILYKGKDEKVAIPESVTRINACAFHSCESLTEIIIPDSVTNIGDYAFEGCRSLTSIIIPNSVTSIGDYAFYECSSLTSVTIPDSVTDFGYNVFYGCDKLNTDSLEIEQSEEKKSIYYDGELYEYYEGIRDEWLADINRKKATSKPVKRANKSNAEKQQNNDPEKQRRSIIKKKRAMFEENCSVTTTIPSFLNKTFVPTGFSVEEEKEFKQFLESKGAFLRAKISGKTDYLIVEPEGAGQKKYEAVLEQSKKGRTIEIIFYENFLHYLNHDSETDEAVIIAEQVKQPEADRVIKKQSAPHQEAEVKTTHSEVKKPKNIEELFEIKDGVLIKSKEQTITEAVIPNSVRSIGNNAFDSCHYLKSVVIPDSVTSIGNCAFSYCNSLMSITIPNSVTSIGFQAFSNCHELMSITIPNSVTSIDDAAFDNCSSLKSITLPDSITSIGNWTFSDCSNLKSITIPNSVTSIESHAFDNCSKLTSITLPKAITSIESKTFNGCKALKNIRIPENVKVIKKGAFESCSKLKTISLPVNIQSFDEEMLSNCDKIEIYGSILDLKPDIRKLEEELSRLESEKNAVLPEIAHLNELEKSISTLQNEIKSLGLFKIKQKKECDERILALLKQVDSLKPIAAEKARIVAETGQKISNINAEKKKLERQMNEQEGKFARLEKLLKGSTNAEIIRSEK